MALLITLETGAAVVGANAYDTTADAAEWLGDRGFTAFVAGDATERTQALILSTESCEREARKWVDGDLVDDEQGLLFPRVAARGFDWEYFESDELPLLYRHGIFVMADAWRAALAAGRRLDFRSRSHVAAESHDGQSLTYRGGAAGAWADHSEAWDLLRSAWPPLPIQQRG